MFFFFNKQKKEIRDAEYRRKEREIRKLNAEHKKRAMEATEKIRKYNALVESQGMGGVLYEATGAKRRNEEKK